MVVGVAPCCHTGIMVFGQGDWTHEKHTDGGTVIVGAMLLQHHSQAKNHTIEWMRNGQKKGMCFWG